MRWRSHILLGFAIAFIAIAPARVRHLHHHADELHRHLCVCRARPCAAHRRRRADVVRPGRVRRHRRLRDGLVHGGARRLAVDRIAARFGADRPRRDDPGRGDAAAQRPLPAAQHHRLGHRHLFRVRQSRCAQPLQRAVRHPADLDRTGLARRHHRDLLLHLDSARRRHAALPQPARFTARPRHPQPARRRCHGGKPRDRQLPHAAGDLRSRRRARRPFRLALCAHAKVRQSDAVRHSPGHRASVHGAGRRRRTDRRRRGRRRDRRPAQERAAGRAARRHPLQRAARSGVLRRAAGHHPAEGARRRRADDPPLSAAA